MRLHSKPGIAAGWLIISEVLFLHCASCVLLLCAAAHHVTRAELPYRCCSISPSCPGPGGAAAAAGTQPAPRWVQRARSPRQA